jgi:hypothetical protein
MLLALGSGVAILLAAIAFKPDAAVPKLVHDTLQILAYVTGGLLSIYGLLVAIALGAASAQFVRRFGSRLEFQSPVRVRLERDGTRPEPAGKAEGRIAILEERVRTQEKDNVQLASNVETQRRAAIDWKRRTEQLRSALDFAVTWLYRRQNWGPGLSHDGKYNEPAPADIWGNQKYEQLGVADIPYEPPPRVPVEPGWEPPETAAGTTIRGPIKVTGVRSTVSDVTRESDGAVVYPSVCFVYADFAAVGNDTDYTQVAAFISVYRYATETPLLSNIEGIWADPPNAKLRQHDFSANGLSHSLNLIAKPTSEWGMFAFGSSSLEHAAFLDPDLRVNPSAAFPPPSTQYPTKNLIKVELRARNYLQSFWFLVIHEGTGHDPVAISLDMLRPPVE